ncbi:MULTISPECIES: PIN domain-containing protein [Thermus]|uniref:PIN domain-containing protein n=1 Tax=Thermus scotoductus TaxID=37636 RepID=A0A348XRE7_THESC|nr:MULTISPECIES: PIN domain-containing protein [Thermus]ETN89726.1 hypothetical protein TNMX_00195 [Thermus sp. NMX2.A1]RTG96840.1 PIN domain-containing protein [Thermus scotoductus]RTG98915.1 PIN domain-containing protein [Thermus scotoductus]RTH00174.1 PIN domain-containing protein [Thermus scotoductus]RTH14537.1 PIN domain-containing protein [Thermus scotoductus]
MRVFLDANVLFSAALGGTVFAAIWALAEAEKIQLLTSPLCLVEAQYNLERKRPEALPQLGALMRRVVLIQEPGEGGFRHEGPMAALAAELPEKDQPVLRAALLARAQVLLTGDVRHFGRFMSREDLPLRIMTPGDFIRKVRPPG